MKTIYKPVFIALLLAPCLSYSQGWIGKSVDTLVAYNSNLLTSPIRVGIGTAFPTAQLHTTSSVRFSGLKSNDNVVRILGTDASGNVYYRDAAALGINAWFITGNAGTNPTTNFLGTTDNNPLVFRTNNANRMHLLADGSLRLRTIASSNLLIRNSPNVSGENDNIGIDFIRNDAADNATTNIKARIQFDGYPLTYPDQSLLHTAYMRFFTNGGTALQQRMVIAPNGNVGIGADYTYPATGGIPVTRPFEVSCVNQPIRLKNLPSGTGNYLVIDASGDVRVSSAAPRIAASASSSEVDALKKEVEDLKNEINALKSLVLSEKLSKTISSATLEVKPNPSTGSVQISSFIPSEVNHASIIISDMNGRVIKKFDAQKGLNTFNYVAGNVSSGNLICSVVGDNKTIADKKIVIAK